MYIDGQAEPAHAQAWHDYGGERTGPRRAPKHGTINRAMPIWPAHYFDGWQSILMTVILTSRMNDQANIYA